MRKGTLLHERCCFEFNDTAEKLELHTLAKYFAGNIVVIRLSLPLLSNSRKNVMIIRLFIENLQCYSGCMILFILLQ